MFPQRIVARFIVLKHFLAYQNENLTLEIQNLSQWIDIFNKKQIANNFAYFTCVGFG